MGDCPACSKVIFIEAPLTKKVEEEAKSKTGRTTAEQGSSYKALSCPYCAHSFCATCRLPNHPGMGCEAAKRRDREERARMNSLRFQNLAKEEEWKDPVLLHGAGEGRGLRAHDMPALPVRIM